MLVLEAANAAAARRVLARLPLVRARLIEFVIDELRAYSGFARLFVPHAPSAKRQRRRAT